VCGDTVVAGCGVWVREGQCSCHCVIFNKDVVFSRVSDIPHPSLPSLSFVMCCSVLHPLSRPIHPSLLPLHLFIPVYTQKEASAPRRSKEDASDGLFAGGWVGESGYE
jgi:hypothetical protein